MALQPPNPALATEEVTLVQRSVARDSSGGGRLSGPDGATYPAIVTKQKLSRDGLVSTGGQTLSHALWDVILFAGADPGVVPQKTKLLVAGQGRELIAEERSTMREAGCWYVLCKSIE